MSKKCLSLFLLVASMMIQHNLLLSMEKSDEEATSKRYITYADVVKGRKYSVQEETFKKLKQQTEDILFWERLDIKELNIQIKKLKAYSSIAPSEYKHEILDFITKLNAQKSLALEKALNEIKRQNTNNNDVSEIVNLSQTVMLNSQSNKQLESVKETEARLAQEQKDLAKLLDKLTIKAKEKISIINDKEKTLKQLTGQESVLGNIFTINETQNELEKLKNDLALVQECIEQVQAKLTNNSTKSSSCSLI